MNLNFVAEGFSSFTKVYSQLWITISDTYKICPIFDKDISHLFLVRTKKIQESLLFLHKM